MAEITDPARELVELCKSLTHGGLNQPGDDYLAKAFDVSPWSAEFFEIVFAILDRIRTLKEIVGHSDMPDSLKIKTSTHLDSMAMAFGKGALVNTWQSAVASHLNAINLGPIEMLSITLSKTHPLPSLTTEEIVEVLQQVEALLSWLNDHQLREQDFIRQALVEGLQQFRFRLSKVRLFGLGYTLESLRDVIGAYMALERGTPDLNAAPDAGAALNKVRSLVSHVYEKIKQVKEAKETADFVLELYGAATLLLQTQHHIAGFLK